MRIIKVKIDAIRYGGELAPCGELRDGECEPIICSEEQGASGVYYDLIDGYHRLGSMVESGETEFTVLVPSLDELKLCREFGGPKDAMTEADWVDHMQAKI